MCAASGSQMLRCVTLQAACYAAKPVRQGEWCLTLAMSSSFSLRSSGNLNTHGATDVVFAAL